MLFSKASNYNFLHRVNLEPYLLNVIRRGMNFGSEKNLEEVCLPEFLHENNDHVTNCSNFDFDPPSTDQTGPKSEFRTV